MTRPRKYRTKKDSDMHNLAMVCIGLGVLFVVWFIAICIQIALEYWYISGPVIVCSLYAYAKLRTIDNTRYPDQKTVDITEDIKINNGTKKVVTREIYSPEKSIIPDLIGLLIHR